MRQITYVSSATSSAGPIDPLPILDVSRRNNLRDGITGLLYFDGRRFLQALEGEPAAVAAALRRIERDPRHRAIVILSDRTVDAREFGSWSMAHRTAGADADVFVAEVARRVADAAPAVKATFASFAEHRRAA